MYKKNISSNKSDSLHDLVVFVQFKNREKHLWRIVTYSTVAGFSASKIAIADKKTVACPSPSYLHVEIHTQIGTTSVKIKTTSDASSWKTINNATYKYRNNAAYRCV